jgi:hypothetical protein
MRHIDVVLLYIDPGSGSILIQALIATVVAVPIVLRQHIGRLARLRRRAPDGQHQPPHLGHD